MSSSSEGASYGAQSSTRSLAIIPETPKSEVPFQTSWRSDLSKTTYSDSSTMGVSYLNPISFSKR